MVFLAISVVAILFIYLFIYHTVCNLKRLWQKRENRTKEIYVNHLPALSGSVVVVFLAISVVAIPVPAHSAILSFAPPPLVPFTLLLRSPPPHPMSHVLPRVPTIFCLPSLLPPFPLSAIS